ncbi:DsrE family protein [Pedobacter cryophilus]|nr:DsrE family protein [Pedobacter cryophilus]
MMNIKVLFFLLVAIVMVKPTYAQSNEELKQFNDAVSKKSKYKVVYQLNTDNAQVIESTLNNIGNSLADVTLKDKLKVELVVHGGGSVLFMKDHPYEKQLLALKEKGVIMVQCLNSMKKRKLTKEQMFPFIFYVESGNAELIIRQQQGWAYIHP